MTAAMWMDLFKTIVPDSVLIIVVGYLAKVITTHQLAKDIDRFRSDLRIDAARDNTVFSRLHERRAEVIAEVYEAVVAAETAVRHYLTKIGAPTPPPGKTLVGVAYDAMWHLQAIADKHRIWFMPEVAAKIDSVVAALRKSWNQGTASERYPEPNESTMAMINDAFTTVLETVPVLRAALESEFRDLLSVHLRLKSPR